MLEREDWERVQWFHLLEINIEIIPLTWNCINYIVKIKRGILQNTVGLTFVKKKY